MVSVAVGRSMVGINPLGQTQDPLQKGLLHVHAVKTGADQGGAGSWRRGHHHSI